MATEDKNTLLEDFLGKFSDLDKLKLEDYTGLKEVGRERDDFTYWVERKLDFLGGIKGGSSAKFGIYKHNDSPKNGSKQDGPYTWSGNFKTAAAAFEDVRGKLCAIKDAAENQAGVLYDKIEGVNLASTYKWKVAFLYSKGRLVPVYKIEALAQAAKRLGIAVDSKDTIGVLQGKLMGYYNNEYNKEKNPDTDIFNFGAYVWKLGSSELLRSNQLIKYGAPGTGKTFTAEKEAKEFFENWLLNLSGTNNLPKFEEHYEFVQFHPSYSYEDFIEGIKPVLENGNTVLKLRNGIFKAFCKRAAQYELWLLENFPDEKIEDITVGAVREKVSSGESSDCPFTFIDKVADNENIEECIPPYFFVIDEINRADLSRVFGELMYCLEYRGHKGKIKTQYSELQSDDTDTIFYKEGGKNYFFIPKNLYIIGTMNTIDRSIESFDFALRRRFLWLRVDPNKEVLTDYFKKDKKFENIIKSWEKLNAEIKEKLGPDYQIGHSYLMKLNKYPEATPSSYKKSIWEKHIQPTLEEYYRGMGQEANNQIDKLRKAFFQKSDGNQS